MNEIKIGDRVAVKTTGIVVGIVYFMTDGLAWVKSVANGLPCGMYPLSRVVKA